MCAAIASHKTSLVGTKLNMVLHTYGLSISSDDECVENRLIDDNDEIISDRKSVNYSDNMLAMSPFAGDYPPTTNFINYTDLDASYSTQGNNFAPCFINPVPADASINLSTLFISSFVYAFLHTHLEL